MIELMVTVAVLGIVAAVVIPANQLQWRRERANAAASELASWLEVVSKTPDQSGTGCTVTITTGSNRPPGSILAQVTPTTCTPESTLNLPGTNMGSSTYSVGASTNIFQFTPRGAVTTDNLGTAVNTNIQVRISINGEAPLRCVQLSGLLGLIRVGSNNTAGDPTTACAAAQFNRA